MIRFDADASLITAEAGDTNSPPRIAGVAVPWDTVATVSGGQQVSFSRGAFDVAQKPAKLLENHDMTQLRGIVNALADTPAGLEFEATLADTRASRDAVALLQAGAYDSVSVGAQPITFTTSADGVMNVTEAALVELSLVAVPAFSGAVITEVAATAADPEPDSEDSDPETIEESDTEMSDALPAEPVEAAATPVNPYQVVYAQTPKALPTPAEYIAAMVTNPAKLDEYHARIEASTPGELVTNDIPGVIPEQIIAPIYNNFIGSRPLVDATGVRAMPSAGAVFLRPVVATHNTVDVNAQLANTASEFTITNVQFDKLILGGYITVSEAALDWSEPAVLGALLDDMGRVYADQTDVQACDALVAGATNDQAFSPGDLDDPAAWTAWLYEAAATILTSSNGNLPNAMMVDPTVWQSLGSLSDQSGRPLFPEVGPMNAFGNVTPSSDMGRAFGLQVVVDRNLPAGTLIVGDTSGIENYEQQRGAVSVEVPSQLARTIAFRGYFASKVLDASKFIAADFGA